MPDCLTTTRSTAPDVRLLRLADRVRCAVSVLDLACISDDMMALAGDLRADIHRPSQQAHDLIELLRRAASEGDAWAVLVDCATTIRGLSDADRVRVVSEALIAVARQREPGL